MRSAADSSCGLSWFPDSGAGSGWLCGREGAVTGSGLVRPLSGWAAAGGEQGYPFVFAVPSFGQVQHYVAVAVAVAGGAGGDVDEVTADGGAAGLAVGEAGQGSGGVQQVVRDGGAAQPGRVGREDPGDGRWASGAVGPVGEDLFHDRVVTALAFGLDQLERGIGEDRVVAPGREQLVLPGRTMVVEVADPAHDQPGGDGLALLRRGERGVFGLGDLGVGDPAPELVISDRAAGGSRSRPSHRWRRWPRRPWSLCSPSALRRAATPVTRAMGTVVAARHPQGASRQLPDPPRQTRPAGR